MGQRERKDIDLDYDSFAPAYGAHRRADPAVLDALAGRAGPRVLEVGAGTGNYAAGLARRGLAVSGVYPSAGMRAAAPVELLPGTADALPFPDAAFDLVFSADVVHHLPDVAAAFREAARVLVPGGRLCTVTDDEASIRRRVHSAYFPETVAVELARYPTLDALADAAAAAGLVPGAVERTETPYLVTDARPFRELAFSSLALIPDEALRAGLERLARDLPVAAVDSHVLVWARRPA